MIDRGGGLFWEGEILSEQKTESLLHAMKLLGKVNDERLRALLTADRVTDIIEDTFRVRAKPTVLYQGQPYIYPGEFSSFFITEDVIQRDIRIEVPCNQIGTDKTVLFARSWINLGKVDNTFKELLYGEEMTIGQIISAAALTVEYQNLGYKQVISEKLAAAFRTQGTVELVQRSRIICHEEEPIIFIHEFVPV